MICELDDVGEITFITKGKVALGYEINKIKKFQIIYKNKCIIGAFNVTFNQRATFIYQSLTEVQGYFIRKCNWLDMMDNYEEVSKPLKRDILLEYVTNIRNKLRMKKNMNIEKLMKRADYQQILTVQEKEDFAQADLFKDFFDQEGAGA